MLGSGAGLERQMQNMATSTNEIVSQATDELKFVCHGTNGIVFTDGQKFFMVWSHYANGVLWTGIEIPDPLDAFPLVSFANYSGAEIDMRQTDEDAMTEEVRLLGDRVADALNAYFTENEKPIRKQFGVGGKS